MSTKKTVLKINPKPKKINLQVMVDLALFYKACKLKSDLGHTWNQIIEAGLRAYIGEKK